VGNKMVLLKFFAFLILHFSFEQNRKWKMENDKTSLRSSPLLPGLGHALDVRQEGDAEHVAIAVGNTLPSFHAPDRLPIRHA